MKLQQKTNEPDIEKALLQLRYAVAIALFGALVTESAVARHGFLHTHHLQGVCSVMSRHPCTPTFCSVFHRGPCIPQIEYPIGQDLRLTVVTTASDKKYDTAGATLPAPSGKKAEVPTRSKINTIREAFDAFRACWIPPLLSEMHAHMQMSIRFSLNRHGGLIAAPRVTYKSPDASPATASIYRQAIMAALDRCTPLPLSRNMGEAIAGRPIAIRFVDDRKQK